MTPHRNCSTCEYVDECQDACAGSSCMYWTKGYAGTAATGIVWILIMWLLTFGIGYAIYKTF